MTLEGWTRETIVPGEAHCHEIIGHLHRATSPYQTIDVVNTRAFGRGLLLDGRIQHLKHDEYIYSETISHPAALALGPECRRVLVIGGGPGGAVREMLKNRHVERVVQVEIDAAIIEVSRKYFAHLSGGFPADPRYSLVIADIREFMGAGAPRFDLVLHDVSEPRPGSPAEFLFTKGHFAEMRELLTPGGVFVTWAGAAGPCADNTAAGIVELVHETFSYAAELVCHTQSYGTSWLFSIGSERDLALGDADAAEIDERIDAHLVAPLKYYDGEAHRHICFLPKDLRNRLATFMEKGRPA